MQLLGIPTPRVKVTGLTALADAEKTAVDYAGSVGVTGAGPAALKALRALPAEGASIAEEIAALSAGKLNTGVAGSMVDGKLVTGAPEAIFAARRQAIVPVIIGANDRDLGVGIADSKDALLRYSVQMLQRPANFTTRAETRRSTN